MSESELNLMYQPQIAELITDCQQVTKEGYEQWKQETRESTPHVAAGFMEEAFAVVDKYAGHQVKACSG